MAKKKATKKVKMKEAPACSTNNRPCGGIMALAIIILTWWKPTETWSQVLITIAAAIILLSAHGCVCKK